MRPELFSTMITIFLFFIVILAQVGGEGGAGPNEFLSQGDSALATDQIKEAIAHYEQGISSLTVDDSLVVSLSLHTNLGTALSSAGKAEEAVASYAKAVLLHSDEAEQIEDETTKKEAADIASQASFYLGMTHQELGNPQKAADAYAFANMLDKWHWSSVANLGAVLHDELKQPAEALAAYNKAVEILTQTKVEPTDAPHDPRYILSQLQYRIGLTIIADPKRKCAMQDKPEQEVPCTEMAANAFSLALEYDRDNENARHMLASITADGTMERASTSYVAQLFDDYAGNFEHSLVEELGYNGYERLRRGFDRAFGGRENIPRNFSVVIDAGCGTGLAGEQFRNVSEYLVGVDLSAAIIEESKKARPNLYDKLIVGDVAEVFRKLKPVSLIIAADSYIYFGDLVPVFKAMQEGVGNEGIIAFTLENVSEDFEKSLYETKPDWRWQLTPSGRFAHRKGYAELIGEQHNFQLIHYERMDSFRLENGVGVRGHLFVMQKHVQDEF